MLLLKIKVIEEMRLRGERRTGLTEAFQEGNQKEFSAEILLIMRQRGRQEEWPEKPRNRENDKTQEENAVNISFCILQSSWGSKG